MEAKVYRGKVTYQKDTQLADGGGGIQTQDCPKAQLSSMSCVQLFLQTLCTQKAARNLQGEAFLNMLSP